MTSSFNFYFPTSPEINNEDKQKKRVERRKQHSLMKVQLHYQTPGRSSHHMVYIIICGYLKETFKKCEGSDIGHYLRSFFKAFPLP